MPSPTRHRLTLSAAAAIGALGLCTASAGASSVFVNEFHYDNVGPDQGEGIEIAGPAGANLGGYSIELVNGYDGAVYATRALSGVLPDQQAGFGTKFFAMAMQNGARDGIALVGPGGVIQRLGYEGTLTAHTTGNDPVAPGSAFPDIGRFEPPSTPVGRSLQLTGSGRDSTSFTWRAPTAASPGAVNAGETFVAPPAPAPAPAPPAADPAQTTSPSPTTTTTTTTATTTSPSPSTPAADASDQPAPSEAATQAPSAQAPADDQPPAPFGGFVAQVTDAVDALAAVPAPACTAQTTVVVHPSTTQLGQAGVSLIVARKPGQIVLRVKAPAHSIGHVVFRIGGKVVGRGQRVVLSTRGMRPAGTLVVRTSLTVDGRPASDAHTIGRSACSAPGGH